TIHLFLTKDGAQWESYVDRVEFKSINDTNNTQEINVFFKGCPVLNVTEFFDTVVNLYATYPFALIARVYLDTSAACPFITSPILMDTFHVPASQITDVNEITNQQNNITIYPNPARQYVTVDIEKIQKNASISIYDIHGRE